MAESQPEAVHRHHGEAVFVGLEEGAGVDRAALVVADGKNGLGNHGFQLGLGQGEGVLIFHRGQLGELLRVGAQDVELTGSTGDVDHIVVGLEGDDVVRQLPDDLAEEPGGQHQGAGFADVGRNNGADAGVQIVAGEPQLLSGLQQNALQSGNGALGGNGTGGGGDGGLQQGFFAGKFHICSVLRFVGREGAPRDLSRSSGERRDIVRNSKP